MAAQASATLDSARFLAVCAFLCLARGSFAFQGPGTDTNWTGALNSQWGNSGNWSNGVPDAGKNAIISSGVPNTPSTAAVANATCAALTVNSGAVLNVASGFPLTVAGSATVQSSGAVNGGIVRFTGSGAITTNGTASLPNVEIAASGVITLSGAQTNIAGTLKLLSGTLQTAVANTTVVVGTATFQGGTLTTLSAASTLDLDGDVSFANTQAPTPPRIRCAKNWSSDAVYIPTGNFVFFDGVGAQNLASASGVFFGLIVQGGSVVTTTSALQVGGTLIVEGSLSTSAGLTVASALTIDGAMSTSGALEVDGVLTVNGALTVAGTLNADDSVLVSRSAALDLKSATHSFAGSLTLDGTLLGSGTLVFDGGGTVSASNGNVFPNVRISTSGSVQLNGIVVAGTLFEQSGVLNVPAGVTTRVGGAATFQGGSLGSGGTLDLDGNATFSGTTVGASTLQITCAGSWNSDSNFNPTGGTVVFDGSGAQSVSTTNGHFAGLSIASSASVSTSTPLVVGGTLTVNGSLTTSSPITVAGSILVAGTLSTNSSLTSNGPLTVTGSLATPSVLDANGTVNVQPQGSLNLGSGTHTFASSVTLLGSTIASGLFRFDGSGTMTVSMPSQFAMPNVEMVGSGVLSLGTPAQRIFRITGQLVQNGGTIANGQLVRVSGDALFQSGVLGAGGALNVDGDITFVGTTATAPPAIQCGGNWVSGTSWNPTVGSVSFDGLAAQTISMQSGKFVNLTIADGANVTTASAIHVSNAVAVLGSFATGAVLDVDGPLTLQPSGTLNLGAATHTVAGNVIANGSLVSTGTLVFDPPVATIVTVSGSTSLPAVRIQGPGTVRLADGTAGDVLTIAATLTQLGGTLAVNANGKAHVLGDASFQSGVIANVGNAKLEVDGDVVFSGATAPTPPLIRCGGDWTADASFAPTSETVELDGSATTSVASATAGGDLKFNTLRIKNGTRRAASDFKIVATQITVDAGGEFDVAARRVAVAQAAPTTLSVAGKLAVGSGGELALGAATTATITATGELALIGTPAAPARVSAEGAGGYSLIVNGLLRARNYVFQEMGANGIVVTPSAAIAAAPDDLRGGTFDLPAAGAGACELNIQRPAPADFRYVVFKAPGGSLAKNVRCLGGAAISFTNWGDASFGGSGHEDDPGGRVTWSTAQHTLLTSFSATPRGGEVVLAWQTSVEVDVERFVLERATSAGGPYVSIAEAVPGAGSYGHVDIGLTSGQPYFYRVSERLTHGAVNLLGSASATPSSASVVYVRASASGANNGTSWPDAYASLQDALSVAVAGNQLWVASGTYKPAAAGGSRTATFLLRNNVAIYGGFAGTETQLSQRNPGQNVTILSGDLNGDDLPAFGNTSDNSLHVVTGDATNATALIDGFTVRGGNANGAGPAANGAGLSVTTGSPVIERCVFLANRATGSGGGGYLQASGAARFARCTFRGNVAAAGAGLYCTQGVPSATRCSFEENAAVTGGGLALVGTGGNVLASCAFRKNSASQSGGAVYAAGAVTTKLAGVMFTGNTAGLGAAAYCGTSSGVRIESASFSLNVAATSGGGVYVDQASPVLANCILWGNSDAGGADESGQIHLNAGSALVHFCCVQGWTEALGGFGNFGSDPLFQDSDGVDGIAGTADDDLRLRSPSPCIDTGDNAAVSDDVLDLDGDVDTSEPMPLDRIDNARFVDAPQALDLGSGLPPLSDIGALEFEIDCNGNSIDDAQEIAQKTTEDCDADLVPDACDIADGFSLDTDENGIPDECGVGVSFCSGDGTLATDCPCGNSGSPGHGCANSLSGSTGARLTAAGISSPDSVILATSGEPPTALTIFLQGDSQIAAGTGFGDGVRCIGGTLKRLYVKNAVGGSASAPTAADLSIQAQSAQLGDSIVAGATRWYQTYYRDPNLAFCPSPPGDSFNVTNGIAITW